MKAIENKKQIVENGKCSAFNSGLLRSSFLTARNDAVPFCELCVSFANLAVKKIKPQRAQRFSQRTQGNLRASAQSALSAC